MLIIFVRTLFLYLLVVIVTRLMGKRQIGELQPYEFVITIMIADLVAVPMQDRGLSLFSGVIPVFTLLLAQVVFSFWSLKSKTFRRILCGKPSPIIENARINWSEMRSNLYHVNDLLEQLRSQGYFNLSDVECALLETNGSLTVLPKAKIRPVTPEDLQLETEHTQMPITLILDGQIEKQNLARAGLTIKDLQRELKKRRIPDPHSVLIAMLDTRGQFFCQTKPTKRKEKEG
ncbi:MAG TPA: DUF421 domain-containing protein [Firmicutes bacterium]|jgi:uncharacterized membrane protein YcaP (DUF421 family)|nr:DUF421 domain-containing protein [Bacillota bacterium]